MNEHYEFGFSCDLSPAYNLETRLMVKSNSVFKIKKYSPQLLLFSAPEARSLIWMDMNLSQVTKVQKYPHKPLALVTSYSAESGEWVGTGCDTGHIIFRRIVNEQDVEDRQQFILQPASQQENFVNDILLIPNRPNQIVNCYNNGNIVIWDIEQKTRKKVLQKIHEMYTYKLRFHNMHTLISCGSDGYAIRTDLNKFKHLSACPHPGGVWCADKIDENCIVSVGLFRRVYVWDVRCRKTVQQCILSGTQSSFVTTCNNNPLFAFFGDEYNLMKWDRRKCTPESLAKDRMLISAEGLLFDGGDLFVCGRGTDICKFNGCAQAIKLNSLEELSCLKVLDPATKTVGGYQQMMFQGLMMPDEEEDDDFEEQEVGAEQEIQSEEDNNLAMMEDQQNSSNQSRQNLLSVEEVQEEQIVRESEPQDSQMDQQYPQIENNIDKQQSQQMSEQQVQSKDLPKQYQNEHLSERQDDDSSKK